MYPRTAVRTFAVLVLLAGGPYALAQTPAASPPDAAPDELTRLRRELTSLRQDYAERLAALEERLKALEAAPAAASPLPLPPPVAPPPPAAALSGGSKVFNPDIAVIGNFLGAAGRSPGGGEPSLEMQEAEASFQAIVDPYARADVFLTFGPEEVGIEEAFLTFPTLPGGLLAKVGKMRDAFGKVDAMHSHVLPWTDRPLVAANLLGGEEGLSDSGISLSRLVPNRFAFLELTGQVYRGESSVFQAPTRGDLSYVGHLRAYRDLTESSNVDLGGSVAYGHNDAGAGFTTRLLGADATFRYRPLRRAIYTHVLGRAELVWSRRQEPSGVQDAFGAYGYLEYQFARRWIGGARLDYSERATDASIADKGGSLLLTYWPSEFSQVRTQYRHTRLGDGRRNNELLFQFLFAIGAHGAHAF